MFETSHPTSHTSPQLQMSLHDLKAAGTVFPPFFGLPWHLRSSPSIFRMFRRWQGWCTIQPCISSQRDTSVYWAPFTPASCMFFLGYAILELGKYNAHTYQCGVQSENFSKYSIFFKKCICLFSLKPWARIGTNDVQQACNHHMISTDKGSHTFNVSWWPV